VWLLLWSQDRYRIRALYHASTIINIISIIERERERESTNKRERERERLTQQQAESDIYRCHSTTRAVGWVLHSLVKVRGSRTPLPQTRNIKAVEASIMCDKTILWRSRAGGDSHVDRTHQHTVTNLLGCVLLGGGGALLVLATLSTLECSTWQHKRRAQRQ